MNKIKNLILSIILILICMSLSAKDIKGNIDNIDFKNNKITININNKNSTFSINSSTKLMRGLIGTELLEVNLISLSAGDAIECTVDEKNVILKANVTFNIIRGTIKSIDKNTLTLTDNSKVVIAEKASISIENGSIGKITDLIPGHTFVARTNPNSGMIWTLVVSGKENISEKTDKTLETSKNTNNTNNTNPINSNSNKENKEVKTPTITPVQESKKIEQKELSIENITLSAPKKLLSGDMILIQVEATPHCGVSCDIQYVSNTKIKLTEDKPGLYSGFITVPDKNLNNAKILAYLSFNGKNISKICETYLTVKNKEASLNNIVIKEVKVITDTEKSTDKNIYTNENEIKEDTIIEVSENKDTTSIEKKESEQNNDNKDSIDKNTNKDSIINTLKEAVTIKIEDIKIVSPQYGASVKDIEVSGIAIPNTVINVKTMYTNNKYGVLSINGILHEASITVNEDGIFNYGPIELKDFFATPGLIYYIELQYTEQPNQTPKIIKVIRE